MRHVVDGLAYPIIVSTAAAEEAAQIGARLRSTVYIVADRNVQLRSDEIVAALASAGCTVLGQTLITAGERCKSWKTVEALHAEFLRAEVDRHSVVFAVGGGTLTDVAGFAAATFMRGVRWVAIPTTLLGMVDAAIGGKTGIDAGGAKNLAGAFWQPSAVIADLLALDSLRLRERRAGLAEAVKSAVIGDPGLLDEVDRHDAESEPASWMSIVRRAALVKVGIVARDICDRGERAMLNLGHTFAHAIETASRYRIAHGEAVAIGLRAAGIVARSLNGWTHDDHRLVLRCLRHVGLRVHLARLQPHAVLSAMQADKKRHDGVVRFVLPVKLGQIQTGIEVPQDILRDALAQLQQRWVRTGW